ncbi:MAG TPA: flavodoxin domain-containing protein [Thermoanaerobaculia bacterium]|nr:flavodoxin domain-containing protein [Thermoanaerobaculia bacterium]
MATKIALVYASRHGHVAAIAERLASIAAIRGFDCAIIDVKQTRATALDGCDAALIAGSVHFGRHASVLRRFVARKLAWLSSIPTAFVSVSGSAAALDGRAKAEEYVDDFIRVTGWQPDLRLSLAGAVLYTKYDPVTRLLMKFASRIAGRDTHTTRDYVYTNWSEADQFMHAFIDTLERHAHAVEEKVRARA